MAIKAKSLSAQVVRVDINSNRYYELTLRQRLVQTPTQEFTLVLTAARRESETELLDTPFRLSLGGDNERRTRISAVEFFQEWTQRSNREVIAARSQFSLGTGTFDATINQDPSDGRLLAWRGQAQWVRLLARDTLLLVRGNVQVSDRVLVRIKEAFLQLVGIVRQQQAILSP